MTLANKLNAGCDCDCETDCTVFADDFDRADSTSLGSDWTESAGSWEISSNKLETSSANALAIYSSWGGGGCIGTAGTLDAGNVKASVTVQSSASGDQVRIGPVELEVGTGKMRLIAEIGGTPTVMRECSVTAAINTDYRLGFIYGREAVVGTLDGVAIMGAGAVQYVGYNVKELSTGTLTGTAVFDDYQIENSYGCDPLTYIDCPRSLDGCWPIVDGANPAQVSVVVSGSSGGTADGTYLLDNIGPSNAGAAHGTHLCYELTGLSIPFAFGTATRARLFVNTAWSSEDIGDCAVYFALDDGSDMAHPFFVKYGALGAVGADTTMHSGNPGATAGCGSAAVTISQDTGPYGMPFGTLGGGTAVCTPV